MALPARQAKPSIAAKLRDELLKGTEPTLGTLPDLLPLSSHDLPHLHRTCPVYELTQNHDAISLIAMIKSKQVTSEEIA
jgi:amidase